MAPRAHVLRSEAEYDAAIAAIERLLDEDVERSAPSRKVTTVPGATSTSW